ncbi:hypothetical protein QQF64_034280 [Cirrhinus molitorella]|uniref:Uncharacterized protein n=1 Tax=Cirrhinus molitorella TaxID=172907 RepID=A0ABR3L1P4_9TELE
MQVYLGCDASGREHYFQYIPVNETLKAFLNNKEQYDKAKGQTSENPHVIQDLVMLCREEDLKFFGQQQVFRPLLSDLKDMEEFGIVLENGETVRGTVIAIVGDNLGSHSIGGFTENFSNENVQAPQPSNLSKSSQSSSVTNQSPASVTIQSPTSTAVPVQSATWMSDFQIPWGDSVLHSKKWMLVIEGKYLFPECDLPDVTSAFAVLFASYYVLNLEYQVEAATTLEFIQRFIVRINPENSKCSSKLQLSKRTGNLVRRKTSGLNPHISTFIQEFLDFTWQNY